MLDTFDLSNTKSTQIQNQISKFWIPALGRNGDGSIPIDTFLVGWTSIYQLFWGSLGTRVLTHPQVLWESLVFLVIVQKVHCPNVESEMKSPNHRGRHVGQKCFKKTIWGPEKSNYINIIIWDIMDQIINHNEYHHCPIIGDMFRTIMNIINCESP